MKTFFVNVRYLIVPLMSALTIVGILLGDVYAWTGVITVSYTHLTLPTTPYV